MANKLEPVVETVGMLWSVRANGSVFLIVRGELADRSSFDVHAVSDGGVEYLGEAPTHGKAMELIQAKCGG